MSERSDVASWSSVMLSSVGERMLDSRGMWRTEVGEVGEIVSRYLDGRSHSFGILEAVDARLVAARDCQFSVTEPILREYM